ASPQSQRPCPLFPALAPLRCRQPAALGRNGAPSPTPRRAPAGMAADPAASAVQTTRQHQSGLASHPDLPTGVGAARVRASLAAAPQLRALLRPVPARGVVRMLEARDESRHAAVARAADRIFGYAVRWREGAQTQAMRATGRVFGKHRDAGSALLLGQPFEAAK